MEEPENGLHPGVIQDVYDALSSVYDSQVLLATHSPIFLSHTDLEHVLCFAKDDEGATDVIPARAHPGLRDWQGDPNLSVFFAAASLVKVGADFSKLIVLAADKHIAASGSPDWSARRRSGHMPDSFDVLRHPESDPGCRAKSVEFLRPLINRYARALVVFDHRGCGSKAPRERIQQEVELGLERNGWPGRSKAMSLRPSWNPGSGVRPETCARAGMGRRLQPASGVARGIRSLARAAAHADQSKEATRQALRRNGKVLSSALFKELAAASRFDDCQDPAFNEFRATLQAWFPQDVGQ